MRKSLRNTALGIIASLGLVASSLALASPAHAYVNSDLSPSEIRVDTSNCPCSYPDPADGTYFQNDPGGLAVKVEWRYPGRGMVAKAEWHPYGEYLWVYDTENDSDTIYVGLYNLDTGNFYGPYSAPGTSTVVEYTKKNFSFAEGDRIRLYFYDGANSTDFLGTSALGVT